MLCREYTAPELPERPEIPLYASIDDVAAIDAQNLASLKDVVDESSAPKLGGVLFAVRTPQY